jgi:hypothetical protein
MLGEAGEERKLVNREVYWYGFSLPCSFLTTAVIRFLIPNEMCFSCSFLSFSMVTTSATTAVLTLFLLFQVKKEIYFVIRSTACEVAAQLLLQLFMSVEKGKIEPRNYPVAR